MKIGPCPAMPQKRRRVVEMWPSRRATSGHSRTATRRSQRYRVLSGRYRNFSITVASFAVPTVDADGCRPVDGHPTHDAWLVAVIVDCLVLRRAVVPDHHIARRPAPAHRVFQPRHMIL